MIIEGLMHWMSCIVALNLPHICSSFEPHADHHCGFVDLIVVVANDGDDCCMRHGRRVTDDTLHMDSIFNKLL